MKKLILLLLPLLLAACATQRMPEADLAPSEALVVHDQRPAEESERKIMSLWRDSPAYGIFRGGQGNVHPTDMRLLQHRVFEHYGPHAVLTVHHMVSYQNMREEILSNLHYGLLPEALHPHISSEEIDAGAKLVDARRFEAETLDNEWKRGTYSEAENEQMGSVYIVYLDAEVEGKRAFIRYLAPAMLPDGKSAYSQDVEQCIRSWMKRIDAS